MAKKINLIAPHSSGQSSILRVHRWLKRQGDQVIADEPLVELVGDNMVLYVQSPGNGTLSIVTAIEGQNVFSGNELGQVSIISKDEVDWENLEQVTEILEDFASKSQNFKQLKDANDALGQLLGVADNPVFFNMNTEQQNIFLQGVIDQYQGNNLSPAEMAQQLLIGLELRPPQFTQGPVGPAMGFGLRGPAGPSPSGMGGMGRGGYIPPQIPPQPYYPPQQSMYPPSNFAGQGMGQGNPAIPQPHAYPSYPVSPAGLPHQGAPYPVEGQNPGYFGAPIPPQMPHQVPPPAGHYPMPPQPHMPPHMPQQGMDPSQTPLYQPNHMPNYGQGMPSHSNLPHYPNTAPPSYPPQQPHIVDAGTLPSEDDDKDKKAEPLPPAEKPN